MARAARAASGVGYHRHEFGDVQLLVREAPRLEPAAAAPGDAAA
jgi:hypothetical protein